MVTFRLLALKGYSYTCWIDPCLPFFQGHIMHLAIVVQHPGLKPTVSVTSQGGGSYIRLIRKGYTVTDLFSKA